MGRAKMVFYRVRKINGHYYLIKEFYDPKTGKKRTVSLGNCEKIEKLVRGVGFEPTQAYATGSSTRHLTRFLKKFFPSNVAIYSDEQAEKFIKVCLETVSYETCKQYADYLRKPLNIKNKWSILAYKKWAKLTGNEELWKKLRTKQSMPDLRIPSDNEMMKTMVKACLTSELLCIIYKLLLESGARLSEIIRMLNDFKSENLKEHEGFYTYVLGYYRGTKRSYYLFTITKPYQIKCSSKWVSNWASKHGLVNPKYVRKYVATKMLEQEIPAEIVNFIQGRTPKNVLERNYLNLYSLALRNYQKYREWLVKVFPFLYSNMEIPVKPYGVLGKRNGLYQGPDYGSNLTY